MSTASHRSAGQPPPSKTAMRWVPAQAGGGSARIDSAWMSVSIIVPSAA